MRKINRPPPAPPRRQAGAGARRGKLVTQRPDDDLVRVAGLPSVLALLETAPERVERLYFGSQHRSAAEPHCAGLARRHKVYRQLGPDEMKRVAGSAMHGGIVALARPRVIRDLDIAEAQRWASRGHGLIVLDGVGNPQNIGAIARTAAFFGVRHMVLSGHPAQAGLSDTAYRVAKGGLEHVELHRAVQLPAVLGALSDAFAIVATAIDDGAALGRAAAPAKPVALVLGNEETGLAPATLDRCEHIVSIPGSGLVQSLNVSATAAILIHALLARGFGKPR